MLNGEILEAFRIKMFTIRNLIYHHCGPLDNAAGKEKGKNIFKIEKEEVKLSFFRWCDYLISLWESTEKVLDTTGIQKVAGYII